MILRAKFRTLANYTYNYRLTEASIVCWACHLRPKKASTEFLKVDATHRVSKSSVTLFLL